MHTQEPISVFRKPGPAVAGPLRLSPRKRLAAARALAGFSAAVLLAVIALDLASPVPARSSVLRNPAENSGPSENNTAPMLRGAILTL